MSRFYAALGGLLCAVLLGAGPAWAQAPPIIPQRTCATQQADAWQQAALKRRLPNYNAAKLAASAPRALRTAAVTYTLPVVVHIVHNGEAVGTGTNISQAQVQSQLDVLNEDYRNLNADGALVPSVFQPLRADVQVQFVAATRDPQGKVLPEPGIDRVSRAAKGFDAPPYATTSYIEDVIKPATYWNPDQYVNIWVMNLGGNVLGYAQFPDNTAGLGGLSPLGGLAATDGVVILYSTFGRVGTLSSGFDRGRTLTHEMGHWLGLRHTWGDADCGDDYCADTPTQQTSNFNCPAFPHVTCSNGPNGDLFMDYMDYVNDACMGLFSGNQKDRIQAVMAAGTPRRTVLLSSPVLCASVAAAAASTSGAACPGGTIALAASGPSSATYAWTGPNGYVSTLQNPVLTNVTASAAGTYIVTTTLNGGACTSTASVAAVVSPAAPVWTGAAGTSNWFDAANWTGCVPTRETDATIPAGLAAPYPLLTSGTAEVRTLTQQGSLGVAGGELALYGDYAGAGPLTQTGGNIATRGTGPQRLRAATYLALTVGGTGTKTIAAATIGQTLTLAGALLDTGPAILTLAPAATLTETDASYVLGQVQTTHLVNTTSDAFGGVGLRLTATTAPGTTTVRRTTGQAQGNGAGTSISRYYDLTAATSSSLRGATLALSYLPHELNGLPPTQLVLFKSTDTGATWSNQGATLRDATALAVSRDYVTDLTGRWTLGSASTPLTPAAITYAINAFPVPFSSNGLAIQVTTPTAGPLQVQLYDVLGRVIYSHAVATVEVGTSTVDLPGAGQLAPAKYMLVVKQANQEAHLNVVRE
ncbi:M43 family zinc metalloprotease [Hymenobacter ginkgonis]|nr:M43 family zinc metalloprotease [Hymenobacter ginkgonis]